MAELSPAEILLDSLVPAQQLIRRLQDLLKAPVSHGGFAYPWKQKPQERPSRVLYSAILTN